MKNSVKVIVALMLVIAMALLAACTSAPAGDDKNDSEDGKTTTTTKAPDTTEPAKGDDDPGDDWSHGDDDDDDDDDDFDLSKCEKEDVAVAIVNHLEADEKAAMSSDLGSFAYWLDHGWCESQVSLVGDPVIDGNKFTFNISHSGACWYGAQFFYNPLDSETLEYYHVKLEITCSPETSITVNGKVYSFTAGETKTIEYDVFAEFHPDDTNFQYGQSVVDIQLGVEEINEDIVDGEYTINIIGIQHYKVNN